MPVIDVHTHGFGLHDTRGSGPDDIIGLAGLHASSGVDAVLPAVYASSLSAMRRDMTAIRTAMERQRKDRSPPGRGRTAEILGAYLEGPFLNPGMPGALDKGSFLPPTVDNCMRLIDGFEGVVRVMTVAPELVGSQALIGHLAERGIIVSMGHSNATYSEAEAGYKAGARGVTHVFNAMRPFHHREPGIAGFALMSADVYIEVIADPYHLSDRVIEFIFAAKDPSRIMLVSDMVPGSPSGDGAHALRDDAGRLRGGSMTITAAARRLKGLGIDHDRIEKAISANPERYLAGPS